ncbi:MAG TPA: DUF1304 domain-containing protein [Glycomyces sp.]|nr:DUF1304 domain-containing protein [Glycomyces sp.]
MMTLAIIAALVSGVNHLAAWVMESFLFHRPNVQQILLGRSESPPEVNLWAFNQGFYNFALAVGAVVGVAVWLGDQPVTGRTLIVFSCSAMAVAGVVLYLSDTKLWRGALAQFLPSTIAVLATLAA